MSKPNRLVLGTVASLLLFLTSMAFFESIASARGQSEHLINVDDHRLYLDCTGEGAPLTVVLEAGAGAGGAIWNTVQKAVSDFARVCSYDRRQATCT